MSGRFESDERMMFEEYYPVKSSPKNGRSKQRFFEQTFTCRHCGAWIHTDAWLSGVQNRNHCPYCLWSLHVDLFKSGDRLAACRGGMRPIGLTLKQSANKYNSQAGELMLIHACEDCGVFSINRVAADDDTNLLVELYQQSLGLEAERVSALRAQQIHLLQQKDEEVLMERLFGRCPVF
jgi:hypothetical protein